VVLYKKSTSVDRHFFTDDDGDTEHGIPKRTRITENDGDGDELLFVILSLKKIFYFYFYNSKSFYFNRKSPMGFFNFDNTHINRLLVAVALATIVYLLILPITTDKKYLWGKNSARSSALFLKFFM
jgi:hypothetical protein